MDEFSHTLLHNQNVFEEFKKIQAAKKAEEEKKQEEAKVTQQMAQLNTHELSPSYNAQYNNDPTFFNHEY